MLFPPSPPSSIPVGFHPSGHHISNSLTIQNSINSTPNISKMDKIKEEPVDFMTKNSKEEGEDDEESTNRFRKVLQNFVTLSKDHSAEQGVIKLITNLVIGTISFEEFEKSIYELTKLSSKQYAVGCFKSCVPIFQKEILQQARNSKMSVIDLVSSQFLEEEEPPVKRRRAGEMNPTPLLVPVHPLSSSTSKSNEEQWRNIDVMLNCILSMVEKTIAAIGILQGRTAEDLMQQTLRLTEDRVNQVRKRAEEAVAEVNRKALLELQRAFSAAESRASQLATCDLPRRVDKSSSLHNSCWNCGRKAVETCSGCNLAKYCGSFCQHKDWESHHSTCRINLNRTNL